MKKTENLTCAETGTGLNDNQPVIIPAFMIFHIFADSAGPGQTAADQERHVSSDGQADFFQLIPGKPCFPQGIEARQHGGGIGTAPAHTGSDGNMLMYMNPGAEGSSGSVFQRERSAEGQVALISAGTGPAAGCNLQRRRRGQGDFIRQGNGLHQHIHEVISIFTLTGNIQGPVDFRVGFQDHAEPPNTKQKMIINTIHQQRDGNLRRQQLTCQAEV